MNASGTHHSDQVQRAFLFFYIFRGFQKRRILKKRFGSNLAIDARKHLVIHTPGADRKMPDFRISHLSPGQTDLLARGTQCHGRIFFYELAKRRHLRARDRVSVTVRRNPESVENKKHCRLWTIQCFRFHNGAIKILPPPQFP